MFILDGVNNHADNGRDGAFFVVGTGATYHGALLAVVGLEGNSSITIPLPGYEKDTVILNVQGMRLKRVDAIEIGGYRYTAAIGELQPGEFFWDVERSIILIKLWLPAI